MTECFKSIVEEEIKTCLVRMMEMEMDQPSMHIFVVHGSDELRLVSSFNDESYRTSHRLATLSNTRMRSKLQEKRTRETDTNLTFHTVTETLKELLNQKQWVGDIYEDLPKLYGRNTFRTFLSISGSS
ncbi:hypothetical protein E1B28_009387 [Marasmius oreades]|uniref:Uncharacterized protein n=1 Tax=Marasmius oreades TaxID=181124 RepID=A0A9P7S0D5_9AGAR|nr:uncharacterized protein E1B28_009387 [Marasmius oreades]KAG7093101.1 hypothetical protein E1B28_009387 [Marasmius oreades]